MLAFILGYVVKAALHKSATAPVTEPSREPVVPQKWTCSMHPQIMTNKPGKCPLCFMDLITVPSQGAELGERRISFSEAALKLMEIETTPVERRFVTAETRMVGKIDYDETRIKNITAWVPGRIDRLYVDFTGITISKGDHMVYLYSPDLISAQAELLQASKAAANLKDGTSDMVRRSTLATLEAAKEKLRLLGLAPEQIENVESSGKPQTHITINSPMGGIVVHKNVTEGINVDTGTVLYTVADLSQLWVKLDAYESDLPWIRYGQQVQFTTEAYPGETFEGTIAFIDPVLNPKTRTVKLRVNVDNREGKLKPNMFVRAVVRSKIAQIGKVMAPEMAGKWICPMHPDIVADSAASCDICGMDLVTTESLGYVKADTPEKPPLVIPASATLITGKRAVVYVRVPQTQKPTFEGREVVLGPRAGDYYIVNSGLDEGETVVTNGSFKIDSALQIRAKPSMMSIASQHKHEVFEVPDEFRKQFWQLVERYLALQTALAGDDADKAASAAAQAGKALSQINMGLLSGEAHQAWMQRSGKMANVLKAPQKTNDIEQARKAFKTFSDELISVLGQFQLAGQAPLYKIHCPMAFNNRGADWLQKDKDTRNPYFGASMLKCGAVTEVIAAQTK
ncbi:MAG: efflux RND transporter periplasmic adaptor subunit [Planctomycetota bacterium]